MDAESGLEPDQVPDLDQFLLARIAEDKRIATDAADAWSPDDMGGASPAAAEHAARHDPTRVLAECAARPRLVMMCRDSAPDLHFLGARPKGLADFTLTPSNQHELAALTLALLALPYADHPDFRDEWRP